MSTETHLKEQLQTIIKNDFSTSSKIKPFKLAFDMMKHIGSPDTQLRDDLIYTTFATWILDHKLFNYGQLRQLLSIALDDQHMFYCIGEINTDSVFTRSFSVLFLPLILISNQEKPFLSEAEIQQIKAKLLQYLNEEKDLRGYVQEKGWAHAVAHVGDAFDDLAQCIELKAPDLLEILNAITAKMCIGETAYIYEEDERMATAVMSVLERQLLHQKDVERWIRNFATLVQKTEPTPENYEHLNTKNFLRSLYFRMRQKNMSEKLYQTVNETLHKISHFKD